MSRTLSEIVLDLNKLQETLAEANPKGQVIQKMFLTLQQRFQNHLLPAIAADDQKQAQVQPLLTEINRSLRLLGMDVAFLQTARRSTKFQQRQKQMGDRIIQLQNFCDGLQQQLEDTEA